MSRFDGKKVKAVFGGKGFYIALALCLLAAGIVGYYTLLRPQAPAEPASNPTTNVPDDRDNAWVAPAVQPEENVPAAPPAEETPISDPQDLLPQVMSPLDGTTVTVFSVTELMYDETMADWRTHNGIDIQASEGDSVRTAASGTVLSVKDDELMGTTVGSSTAAAIPPSTAACRRTRRCRRGIRWPPVTSSAWWGAPPLPRAAWARTCTSPCPRTARSSTRRTM